MRTAKPGQKRSARADGTDSRPLLSARGARPGGISPAAFGGGTSVSGTSGTDRVVGVGPGAVVGGAGGESSPAGVAEVVPAPVSPPSVELGSGAAAGGSAGSPPAVGASVPPQAAASTARTTTAHRNTRRAAAAGIRRPLMRIRADPEHGEDRRRTPPLPRARVLPAAAARPPSPRPPRRRRSSPPLPGEASTPPRRSTRAGR